MRRGWLALVLCLWVSDQRPSRDESPDELAAPSYTAAAVDIGKGPADPLEKLARASPIAFLEKSLEKYDAEVKGYTLTFFSRERIKGKLRAPEKREIAFREKPFSVYMKWIEGGGLASKVLYVEGEYDNKLLARPPLSFLGIFTREVNGPDAKASGRYTIDEFGFKRSTQRTLKAMVAAKARGALHVRYDGIVDVPELGGQQCYKFVRTPYVPAEEDALDELTLFFDREHLLQVGSILRDAKRELLAEYFFYDIKLNPTFPPNQFKKEGL
jgi:hypothetical protein